MNDNEYVPWPEGYGMVDVETIDGVAYAPGGQKAIILVTSKAGLKVCFAAPLNMLNAALLQIQTDPLQTRLRLVQK